ncbi:hypothetical protein BASA61_006480 [Batrachochytrium salamandrivorans]|nr:hypothetical protein BASA61_006480 [Batrachochytrium salamandrivorans]
MTLPEILWCLLVLIVFCACLIVLLRLVLLPYLIQQFAQKVSLNHELSIETVQLKTVTDDGLRLALAFSVLGSAAPVNIGIITVRIISPIRVLDAVKGSLWATVLVHDPIHLGGALGSVPTDMYVSLDQVDVMLGDSLDGLKQVVRRVSIGGIKEAEHISLRFELNVTLDFFGLMTVANVALCRTLNVGEMMARAAAIEKRRAAESVRMATTISQITTQIGCKLHTHDHDQEAVHHEEQEQSHSQDLLQGTIKTPVPLPDESKQPETYSLSSLDIVGNSSDTSLTKANIQVKPMEKISDETIPTTSTPNDGKISQSEISKFITYDKKGIPQLNKTAIHNAINEATKEALKKNGISELFAIRTISHLPVKPHMRSILGGLDIQFDTIPNLTYKFTAIRFNVILNDSKVAHGTIRGFEMSDTRKDMQLILEIVPAVVSEAPILGIASTAKGMLKGAVKGALNGFLYGNWGAGSTIVSLSDIQVDNEEGRSISWLDELLSVVELEHDLDAVRKLGSSARHASGKPLTEGFALLTAGILEAAGTAGSRCTIM